jgi:RNA polymerase sigma-70 factor (ECF subfamily)
MKREPEPASGGRTGAETAAVPVPTLREVFDAHAPYVWRTLRRLGVDAGDVNDCCQEVFIVVHRRLKDFDGTSSMRTWLYGIAIRVASQYRRRAQRRYEELPEVLPDVSDPPLQESELWRNELLGRLDAVLERLDENKRTVFVLYELEELTMNEVAQVLDCPLQTAYARLHAARDIVRKAFVAVGSVKKGRGP